MSNDAPKRLLDSASELGSDASLLALLESGRNELPDGNQLARLASRLGPILDPGGGGPSDGGGSPTGGEALGPAKAAGAVKAATLATPMVKLVSVMSVGIAAAVGGASIVRGLNEPRPLPTSTANTAVTVPVEAASTPPKEAVVPAITASDELPTPPATKALVSAPSSPSAVPEKRDLSETSAAPSVEIAPPDKVEPQETELKALQRAQDALRSNPEEALSICNQSGRIYPRGMLGQEREVIAIEALVRLGRKAEANQRAEQFVKAFPRSALIRRLETLLGRKF